MIKITLEKSQYHRFSLIYDYHPEKVQFCQELKESFGWQKFSFNSNGGQKRWIFSDSLFVPVIKERFPEVQIEPAVESIVLEEQAWLETQKKKTQQIDIIKNKTTTDFQVSGLKEKLYDFQRVGVEFLTVSGGRAIIADGMGLGKTAMALAYIKYMNFQRTLVVCPASVKFSWANEIKKWTRFSSVVIDSKTKISEIDAKFQIWIINYDILAKSLNQLGKIRFDCIIGDECQLIKTIRAQRTRAFRIIAKLISSVVLLSGTPLLSRPVELFSLLNIIDPKTWDNYYDFTRRYCAAHQTRWGLDVSGASNINELHARIRQYFIRRDKTEVLKELPPKNFIDVPVELDGEYLKQYSVAAKSLANYLRTYAGKQPPEIARTLEAEKLSQLNVLRQLNAMGKIGTATELIESIIDTGEKVLVFSSFVEPLRRLKEHFGDTAVVLTGETPVNERECIVRAFQTDSSVKVFLGGYKSAGLGITLTAAQNFMGIDWPWNPADLQQSIDRLHRPGQMASNVNIYQLSAIGTIDDDMKDILDHKQDIFDKVIDGKKSKPPVKKVMDAAVQRVLKNY